MPDLAGVAVEPVEQFAVEDEPAADAGADEDAEDVARPLGRPADELAVGAHAHVVLDDDRPRPLGGDGREHVVIFPAEVRGEADLRRGVFDLTGDAQPEAADVGRIDLGLADDGVHRLDDAGEHPGRADLVAGRLLRPREQVEVVVEDAGQDFRPAEIDTDPVTRTHGPNSAGGGREVSAKAW